ncbi:MAG: lysine--tRNA ligase [Fimbriimonadales bacterium]
MDRETEAVGEREVRLAKLAALRQMGRDPYRIERFDRSHPLQEIHDRFAELEGKPVSVAGRVVSHRSMGKVVFVHLADATGKLQIYFRKDDLPEDWQVVEQIDIGDLVGVHGEPFVTRTGEQSVHARRVDVLAKCLQTLPLGKEKEGHQWYGLHDREQRYRYRHLDLIANRESYSRLVTRSKMVSAVRAFLDSEGFLEVETPVLQYEAGGAAARPFVTHHNALGVDLKLRISLELYLKRLLIGGIEKVYEIGRVFRNEGLSTKHLPEFTLLELYQAYVQLEDIMTLTERLFHHVAVSCFGGPVVNVGEAEIDFSQPWRRMKLTDAIEERTGIGKEAFASLESAKKAGESLGLDMSEETLPGGIMEKVMERFVQPHLIQPTFLTDYPLDTSPLAKKTPEDPRFVRRFEGFVMRQEVANAFSELNDPLDQRERLTLQAAQRDAGDAEAHPMDEEFVYAMEAGMPPAGGLGIGLDRMAIVLLGAGSIRDVVFFPTLRPEAHTQS